MRTCRVVERVVHDEDLERQVDRRAQAIEARDDAVALVVYGDDDRDARCHTRSPLPRRFHMSTTGVVPSSPAEVEWGVAITRRSDSARTSSSGHGSRSPST